MTMLRPIQLLIAEPHEMVRLSLDSLISVYDNITKVGEARNGSETVRLCDQLRPHVVILGQHMADMDGISVARQILKSPNPPYLIMLDGLMGEEHERAALDAGINVYFTVDTPIADVIDAIYAAAR